MMTSTCERIRFAARPRPSGFTLIELMVVVAVVVVLITLAAPSFKDMITMQRLRGVNAQLVTDLQYARSEAVARGRIVRLNFGSTLTSSCYVLYTANSNSHQCSCSDESPTCASSAVSLRNVSVPKNTLVTVEMVKGFEVDGALNRYFGFDPITGGLLSIPTDEESVPLGEVVFEVKTDTTRILETTVVQTGRPSVCTPEGGVSGVTSC